MTSVAAEQFHREHDPLVHYGPVWNKPGRRSGESFAACSRADTASLTTHKPSVTCPECKDILSEGITELKQ